MNTVLMNTVTLDDGKIIVKGSGSTGGGGGTGGGGTAIKWTGHADVEGLKAIGWTDEDIAYYQENGVNWNAEDDEYHKVTDDNKALYGVLTAGNISSYKERIVYLPKIDTSGVTSMYHAFNGCYLLVAIPMLDTSNVNNMSYAFYNCYSLVCVPPLNTSKVVDMSYMFQECRSLEKLPPLDYSKVLDMSYMLRQCYKLNRFPSFSGAKPSRTMYIAYHCTALVFIPYLNYGSIMLAGNEFDNCYNLVYAGLANITKSIAFKNSSLLSKECLLYIINNEAATSAITITLHSYAYTRLSTDADIVAALAAHPNISISQ